MKKLMLIITLLSVLAITNAQVDENKTLDTDFVQENELKMPPEITERVVTKIKNSPIEDFYRYGIKNKEQLENLQMGRPVPVYIIDNDTLKLSSWRVPFMYEGNSIFLSYVTLGKNGQYRDSYWSGYTMMGEGIHRYERKDLMGILQINEWLIEYFYIRRENKDIFIEVYDWKTRGYFKNEYSFTDVINRRNKALEDPKKLFQVIFGTNAQVDENGIFDTNFPQKHELKMTPEITEMLLTELYWNFINSSDEYLSRYGITNRAQLDNLHLGKPFTEYWIDLDHEILFFTGNWYVSVMSDDKPLFMAWIREGDGKYRYAGGREDIVEDIHNYEHKELIIGYITKSLGNMDYFIINKEHKILFTHEYLKNEYSLSELINHLKELDLRENAKQSRLDSLRASIKEELIMTPEITEVVVKWLKKLPEEYRSNYGIINKAQLENLHISKPIPNYSIVHEALEIVSIYNLFRMPDGEPLSLRFTGSWKVLVMSDGEPLSFGNIQFSEYCEEYTYSGIPINNIEEHFHNYEHKDLLIGSLCVPPSMTGIDYLIINKENKDIFVKVYDEITGEYFKYEYTFSELINHLKELGLREKEARMIYFDKVADKSELIMTPEITEMLVNQAYSSHINNSDEMLSRYGIKSRAQLENLYLGKPVPEYWIDFDNEKLIFSGKWNIPVMSDGEPLFFRGVKLEDDGRYSIVGGSAVGLTKNISNYEHKDLIIGSLYVGRRGYLIIRKDNKDIFVEMYDYDKRDYFKNEYSLSELINFFKK
ncbi:MAG: hypothetical protein FWC34_05845 [Bacteroidetes bacterium]|nr:hypothetical protein [Bacteroidota bacterium]MCL2301782.1 hypothetical protein [Lentimicrobiaceae bacterium]